MTQKFNKTCSLNYDLDDLPLHYRLKYPELRGDTNYQSPENHLSEQEEVGNFSSNFSRNFNVSDESGMNGKNLDYSNSEDSRFIESSMTPEVEEEEIGEVEENRKIQEIDREEIIEELVEEHEELELIQEEKIQENLFNEIKIQSKTYEQNILLEKNKITRENLNFLAPKKRILKQWETNDISTKKINKKNKIEIKKKYERKGLYENDENFDPNKKTEEKATKGFKLVVRQEKMSISQENEFDKENQFKVLEVQKLSQEISWNIEERHRDFLNYFDFDSFKIL